MKLFFLKKMFKFWFIIFYLIYIKYQKKKIMLSDIIIRLKKIKLNITSTLYVTIISIGG